LKLIDNFLKNSELFRDYAKNMVNLTNSVGSIITAMKTLAVEVGENAKRISELNSVVRQMMEDLYNVNSKQFSQESSVLDLNVGQASKRKNTVN
jgi:hypothetical protein